MDNDVVKGSCFQLHGTNLEILLLQEHLRVDKRQVQTTKVGLVQLAVAMSLQYFLKEMSNFAVALLQPGSGSIGIIGLSLYLQKSKRAIVITASLGRANELMRSLAFPMKGDWNFFEKAELFGESWTDDEKLEFLPLGRLHKLKDQPLDRFAEDVIFVDGSGLKQSNAWVKENLSNGLACADLLIVDQAHLFLRKTWDIIDSEYRRSGPSNGQLIFITNHVNGLDQKQLYDRQFEAFNGYEHA